LILLWQLQWGTASSAKTEEGPEPGTVAGDTKGRRRWQVHQTEGCCEVERDDKRLARQQRGEGLFTSFSNVLDRERRITTPPQNAAKETLSPTTPTATVTFTTQRPVARETFSLTTLTTTATSSTQWSIASPPVYS
jgi:hypothetical protein